MSRTPQERTDQPHSPWQPDPATPPPALQAEQIDIPTPPHGVPRWEPEEGDFT